MAIPPDPFLSITQQAANKYGVPVNLLQAQQYQESGYSVSAVSPSGAEGIAQFMPSTAASLGVNPWNPQSAIMGQAHLMAMNKAQFGSWQAALEAYNGGAAGVGGSSETQYANTILTNASRLPGGLSGTGTGTATGTGTSSSGSSGSAGSISLLKGPLGTSIASIQSQTLVRGLLIVVGILVAYVGVKQLFSGGSAKQVILSIPQTAKSGVEKTARKGAKTAAAAA